MSASAARQFLETIMESLKSALPSPRDGERQRDPLDIFREFLDRLGNTSRRVGETAAKANGRRAGKPSN